MPPGVTKKVSVKLGTIPLGRKFLLVKEGKQILMLKALGDSRSVYSIEEKGIARTGITRSGKKHFQYSMPKFVNGLEGMNNCNQPHQKHVMSKSPGSKSETSSQTTQKPKKGYFARKSTSNNITHEVKHFKRTEEKLAAKHSIHETSVQIKKSSLSCPPDAVQNKEKSKDHGTQRNKNISTRSSKQRSEQVKNSSDTEARLKNKKLCELGSKCKKVEEPAIAIKLKETNKNNHPLQLGNDISGIPLTVVSESKDVINRLTPCLDNKENNKNTKNGCDINSTECKEKDHSEEVVASIKTKHLNEDNTQLGDTSHEKMGKRLVSTEPILPHEQEEMVPREDQKICQENMGKRLVSDESILPCDKQEKVPRDDQKFMRKKMKYSDAPHAKVKNNTTSTRVATHQSITEPPSGIDTNSNKCVVSDKESKRQRASTPTPQSLPKNIALNKLSRKRHRSASPTVKFTTFDKKDFIKTSTKTRNKDSVKFDSGKVKKVMNAYKNAISQRKDKTTATRCSTEVPLENIDVSRSADTTSAHVHASSSSPKAANVVSAKGNVTALSTLTKERHNSGPPIKKMKFPNKRDKIVQQEKEGKEIVYGNSNKNPEIIAHADSEDGLARLMKSFKSAMEDKTSPISECSASPKQMSKGRHTYAVKRPSSSSSINIKPEENSSIVSKDKTNDKQISSEKVPLPTKTQENILSANLKILATENVSSDEDFDQPTQLNCTSPDIFAPASSSQFESQSLSESAETAATLHQTPFQKSTSHTNQENIPYNESVSNVMTPSKSEDFLIVDEVGYHYDSDSVSQSLCQTSTSKTVSSPKTPPTSSSTTEHVVSTIKSSENNGVLPCHVKDKIETKHNGVFPDKSGCSEKTKKECTLPISNRVINRPLIIPHKKPIRQEEDNSTDENTNVKMDKVICNLLPTSGLMKHEIKERHLDSEEKMVLEEPKRNSKLLFQDKKDYDMQKAKVSLSMSTNFKSQQTQTQHAPMKEDDIGLKVKIEHEDKSVQFDGDAKDVDAEEVTRIVAAIIESEFEQKERLVKVVENLKLKEEQWKSIAEDLRKQVQELNKKMSAFKDKEKRSIGSNTSLEMLSSSLPVIISSQGTQTESNKGLIVQNNSKPIPVPSPSTNVDATSSSNSKEESCDVIFLKSSPPATSHGKNVDAVVAAQKIGGITSVINNKKGVESPTGHTVALAGSQIVPKLNPHLLTASKVQQSPLKSMSVPAGETNVTKPNVKPVNMSSKLDLAQVHVEKSAKETAVPIIDLTIGEETVNAGKLLQAVTQNTAHQSRSPGHQGKVLGSRSISTSPGRLPTSPGRLPTSPGRANNISHRHAISSLKPVSTKAGQSHDAKGKMIITHPNLPQVPPLRSATVDRTSYNLKRPLPTTVAQSIQRIAQNKQLQNPIMHKVVNNIPSGQILSQFSPTQANQVVPPPLQPAPSVVAQVPLLNSMGNVGMMVTKQTPPRPQLVLSGVSRQQLVMQSAGLTQQQQQQVQNSVLLQELQKGMINKGSYPPQANIGTSNAPTIVGTLPVRMQQVVNQTQVVSQPGIIAGSNRNLQNMNIQTSSPSMQHIVASSGIGSMGIIPNAHFTMEQWKQAQVEGKEAKELHDSLVNLKNHKVFLERREQSICQQLNEGGQQNNPGRIELSNKLKDIRNQIAKVCENLNIQSRRTNRAPLASPPGNSGQVSRFHGPPPYSTAVGISSSGNVASLVRHQVPPKSSIQHGTVVNGVNRLLPSTATNSPLVIPARTANGKTWFPETRQGAKADENTTTQEKNQMLRTLARMPSHVHPADLPILHTNVNSNMRTTLLPPPSVRITHSSEGVVLSWNIQVSQEHPTIKKYFLYAYQVLNTPPSTSHWKRIGEVGALAPPMACTLNQFQPGSTYFLAICAVDVYDRPGAFSKVEEVNIPT